MLDLALTTGRSPRSLTDGAWPDVWELIDLEVVSQWRRLSEDKCAGCGRPLRQHLFNSMLGREETPEDYTALSVDCPAQQALAQGQAMWRQETKGAHNAYMKGQGPDPSQGVFWLAQGPGELLPKGDGDG